MENPSKSLSGCPVKRLGEAGEAVVWLSCPASILILHPYPYLKTRG